MKGIKWLAMLLTLVITSFYFFPFEFNFLPGANTKMILAGIGLGLLGLNLARQGRSQADRHFLMLSAWAVVVSFFAFAAVTLNETRDYTYVTYIVSMWVWLGGAYTATQLMKAVHGRIDVELVCHYLIAVCVGQCVIAYAMDQLPWLKSWVDGFLSGHGFMGKVDDRIYGIGASLDVAGMRFAAMLCIITYLALRSDRENSLARTISYLVSFLIIAYIGNMMGRTTTVGALVSVAYAIWVSLTTKGTSMNVKQYWKVLAIVLMLFLPLVVYKYNTDLQVHERIRFAFEGFFSLAETGEWKVHSNEILKNMYVLPDETKTWMIGDGYLENPLETDPYYTGKIWGGFYHGTDVGYLRFIFYFGIFGTLAFVFYMYLVAKVCMERFKEYKVLFLLVLLMNYLVWCKVSSDLFLIFAIFLCLPSETPQSDEEAIVPDVR